MIIIAILEEEVRKKICQRVVPEVHVPNVPKNQKGSSCIGSNLSPV